MTGDRKLKVITKSSEYLIPIRNKYTLLAGDSATGKTAIRDFVREILNTPSTEEEDNYIESDFESIHVAMNETSLLFSIQQINSLVIIDEDMISLLKRNLQKVRESNNFYLIITRELDINLPYGIKDVLVLETNVREGLYVTVGVPFIKFEESKVNIDLCITEDSKSGYKFFEYTLNVECVSAKGKTRIPKLVKRLLKDSKTASKNILFIVDEVGFGHEYMVIYKAYSEYLLERVYFWCPYSFEYVLLNSNMFTGIRDIILNPYSVCDFDMYRTVEVFIENVLKRELLNSLQIKYRKGDDITCYFREYIKSIFENNFDNYKDLVKDFVREI